MIIKPGPVYRPHSPIFQSEFMEFPEKYEGYILTTSSKKEMIIIGNFVFLAVKHSNSKLATVKFFLFCIYQAAKLRIKKERVHLVTTYDPLLTGIIGLIVSAILKAKFAPEVNGVYTSPNVWTDNANAFGTKLKKSIYPLIMRFILSRADGIKLLFKEQVKPFDKVLKGKTIYHFACYVNVDSFKNITENKEVLFAGFPFKIKGVDILINAFKKVASKYPDWRLKILGWYPDPKELNEAIGGHPQIYHHKPVPYQDMVEHIGSCAILVLPSRSEAMGRVLVEAMAAGKPRIGSRVDGIPTVIKDGVDGLLVETENVDDLADKLDRLMSSPELRKRLGAAGEMRARKEFTREVYFGNMKSFFEEVLQK